VALSSGTRLGPYEVQSPLGSGGMGEVYAARDTRLERTVAIKILPERLTDDPAFRERFDREARIISQLDHPHICALYDVGEEQGRAFLVMQYLEGETLAARLQSKGALNAAHRAGVVHRDLKPGNVTITKAGSKLLDFGLAKAGATTDAGAGQSALPTTLLAAQARDAQTVPGTIPGTFQCGGPRSSARLGSACSPTSDSPPPSGRRADGSRTGHRVAGVSERRSTSAQSAGDASAAAYPVSRSSRFPARRRGPRGTPAQPSVGDPRRSSAADDRGKPRAIPRTRSSHTRPSVRRVD